MFGKPPGSDLTTLDLTLCTRAPTPTAHTSMNSIHLVYISTHLNHACLGNNLFWPHCHTVDALHTHIRKYLFIHGSGPSLVVVCATHVPNDVNVWCTCLSYEAAGSMMCDE